MGDEKPQDRVDVDHRNTTFAGRQKLSKETGEDSFCFESTRGGERRNLTESRKACGGEKIKERRERFLPPSPFLTVAQERNEISLSNMLVTDRFPVAKRCLALIYFR